MLFESIWGPFGSHNGVIFELENDLGEKVRILKNIGFT